MSTGRGFEILLQAVIEEDGVGRIGFFCKPERSLTSPAAPHPRVETHVKVRGSGCGVTV